MTACTFFGHKECYGLDGQVVFRAIEELISQGIDTFYVGNQGQFDSTVYSCLKQLRKKYPHIRVCVVLAYLPTEKNRYDDMEDTMYPEIEGHPKFAIERRNNWMIANAEYCICHIDHTQGGAYKFAKKAQRQGRRMISLGNVKLESLGEAK